MFISVSIEPTINRYLPTPVKDITYGVFTKPRQVNGLSDSDPCTRENGLVNLLKYNLLPKEYEDCIQTITERLNWNMPFGSWCYPLISGKDCYHPAEVGCIVSTYFNHAATKEFPVYSPGNKDIDKKVSSITGRPQDRVQLVLEHLYYATKDGSIKTDRFLDPVKFEANKEDRKNPAGVDSWDNTIGTIMVWVKWIAIIALLGAGIYFLFPFVSPLLKA